MLYQSTWETNESNFCEIFEMKLSEICHLSNPHCQLTQKNIMNKSYESANIYLSDIAKIKHGTEMQCPYFVRSSAYTYMKGQNNTFFRLFKCCWVTDGYMMVNWKLSANVIRTFRKLFTVTFWEHYSLTLFGLSGNVLLTFYFVGWERTNELLTSPHPPKIV